MSGSAQHAGKLSGRGFQTSLSRLHVSKCDKIATIPITYHHAVGATWLECMEYIVPPAGIPLNVVLDILVTIGGNSVKRAAQYTIVIFKWDVNEQVATSGVTMINEDFSRTGQLLRKSEINSLDWEEMMHCILEGLNEMPVVRPCVGVHRIWQLDRD